MNESKLSQIANLALDFGQVERATYHQDGVAHESDTTHTVMLGLIAVEVAAGENARQFRQRAVGGFDTGKVAAFALIHDLVEARTPGGDTNSFAITPEAARAKEERELEGLKRLREEFAGTYMLYLIEQYEVQTEPEARLVRYLDKVMPKLTHALNGGVAIKAMGVTFDTFRTEHQRQGAKLAAQYPELAALVGPIFDAACVRAETAFEGETA